MSMLLAALTGADPEKAAAWGKILKDIGVPLIMLAGMSYAMYAGGIWIGEHILIPTLQKNEELVAGQVESNRALLQSLHQITEHIRIQTEANKTNTDSIVKMAGDISAIRVATEATAAEKARLVELGEESQEMLKDILDKP